MVDPDKAKEKAKAILYVLGVLSSLDDDGYIKGGEPLLTPKGIAEFDQLSATGYRVDRAMILPALMTLGLFPAGELAGVATLIEMRIDGKLPT